MVNSSLTTAQN
jgi:hypothetical protein